MTLRALFQASLTVYHPVKTPSQLMAGNLLSAYVALLARFTLCNLLTYAMASRGRGS